MQLPLSSPPSIVSQKSHYRVLKHYTNTNDPGRVRPAPNVRLTSAVYADPFTATEGQSGQVSADGVPCLVFLSVVRMSMINRLQQHDLHSWLWGYFVYFK